MREVLRRLWAVRRLLIFYAVLLTAGWAFGHWLRDLAVPEMRPMNEPMIHRFVIIALLVFIVTAALPFVPGAEIGFALLLLFGAKAAPIVYVGMLGALVLSFSVATFLPRRPLGAALSWLGLTRLADLATALDNSSPEERRLRFAECFPSSLARRLIDNRYLVLAVALNFPGNSVVGGGGGLAFASGLSGLYAFIPFVAVVACAVAPVPLFFVLMGSIGP